MDDEIREKIEGMLERFETGLASQLWSWTSLLSKMLVPFMEGVEGVKQENSLLRERLEFLEEEVKSSKRVIAILATRINELEEINDGKV